MRSVNSPQSWYSLKSELNSATHSRGDAKMRVTLYTGLLKIRLRLEKKVLNAWRFMQLALVSVAIQRPNYPLWIISGIIFGISWIFYCALQSVLSRYHQVWNLAHRPKITAARIFAWLLTDISIAAIAVKKLRSRKRVRAGGRPRDLRSGQLIWRSNQGNRSSQRNLVVSRRIISFRCVAKGRRV